MSFKKGSGNFKSKLTVQAVKEIYEATGVTQQKLADQYGVSQSAIAHIRLGYTWTHVTGHNREWNV